MTIRHARHVIVLVVERLLALAVLAVFAGTVLAARTSVAGLRTPVAVAPGAVSPLSPAQLQSAAAAALEAAVAKGGGGITFSIVQTATLHSRRGGPKVDVPDPSSRGSLGLADQYQVGSTIERGAYTPDGFWMEMRAGPAAGEQPDWDGATYEFGAIVKAGRTYRNDGQGWYPTTAPPGIGLDPKTAALLPTLVKDASGLTDRGSTFVGLVPVRNVDADVNLADAPGIMAVDAATFSSPRGPFTFRFDDLGRLVGLHAVVQNTKVTDYDLLVDTAISFDYPILADPIADPSPAWTPKG